LTPPYRSRTNGRNHELASSPLEQHGLPILRRLAEQTATLRTCVLVGVELSDRERELTRGMPTTTLVLARDRCVQAEHGVVSAAW
jgi:hypothetical protein